MRYGYRVAGLVQKLGTGPTGPTNGSTVRQGTWTGWAGSSALSMSANVTNITLQDQCTKDSSDHLEIANDPVAMADMLNALDPAQPVQVPCLVVLPVFGPIGPVPGF